MYMSYISSFPNFGDSIDRKCGTKWFCQDIR